MGGQQGTRKSSRFQDVELLKYELLVLFKCFKMCYVLKLMGPLPFPFFNNHWHWRGFLLVRDFLFYF